jgi:hypothetical protein
MELLRIHCPTCNARLKLRDPRLLGQIVHCPKCGSMMQVENPAPSAEEYVSAAAIEPEPSTPENSFPTLLTEPLPAPPTSQAQKPTPATTTEATDASLDDRIRPYRWLLWGAAALLGLGVGVGIFGGLLLILALLGKPEDQAANAPQPPPPVDLPQTDPAPQQREPDATPANTDDPANELAPIDDAPSPELPATAEPTVPDDISLEPTGDDSTEINSDSLPPNVTPYLEDEESPSTDAAPDLTTEPTPAVEQDLNPAPLPAVNLAERLAQPIPSVALKNSTLKQAVDFLAQINNVWISWDLDALHSLDLTLSRPVSFSSTDTTFSGALDSLLAPLDLIAVPAADQLRITAQGWQETSLPERTFDVAFAEDILPEVPLVVSRLCRPGTWQSRGGQGQLQLDGTNLLVRQPARDAALVSELLDTWKQARQSAAAPQSTMPLRQRAARCLAAPVTASFFAPTPLLEITDFLATKASCQIIIDATALRTYERLPTLPARLSVENAPLATALDQLLTPLDLGYRLTDQDTIEIVPLVEMPDRPRVDRYSFAPWITAGGNPAQLATRLDAAIPASSKDSGGWHWDDPSQSLLVVLDEPGHASVEPLWLELNTPPATQSPQN